MTTHFPERGEITALGPQGFESAPYQRNFDERWNHVNAAARLMGSGRWVSGELRPRQWVHVLDRGPDGR